MRYRSKKQSKRYCNKSPYLSRTRRYVPNLGKGGGYSGPRPYARSNFRHETIPSSSAESYIHKPSSEHYQIPTRERYEPEIQRLIFELNQLRNQKAIEQNAEKSTAHAEPSPQGILLREMMGEQAGSQQKDLDTIESAEAVFKKSSEEEQARLDSFTEWVDGVARPSHPEPLYLDDEPVESVQVPKVELEASIAEQTPALEVQNVDLEMLISELYANPLETKKEVEPIEQAENNVY